MNSGAQDAVQTGYFLRKKVTNRRAKTEKRKIPQHPTGLFPIPSDGKHSGSTPPKRRAAPIHV